jgi:hypothetical protein
MFIINQINNDLFVSFNELVHTGKAQLRSANLILYEVEFSNTDFIKMVVPEVSSIIEVQLTYNGKTENRLINFKTNVV